MEMEIYYVYPDGRRKYVRIYTPDVSEAIWIVRVSKEIFGKQPIISLDKPRKNKKLYIFRLEFHNSEIYNFFSKINITSMSYYELLSFLSGIIYAEGHIKIKRRSKNVFFDILEIELRKESTIRSLIRTCRLLGINIKFYRRLKRKSKVYYIRERYLVEKIMNIEHV